MHVGILTLHIHLPGCKSLKEKRSRIKPLLARLHKEFNVSTAELDFQDTWQDSVLGCAIIGSDSGQVQRSLQAISRWIESDWRDVSLVDDRIELI